MTRIDSGSSTSLRYTKTALLDWLHENKYKGEVSANDGEFAL